MKRILTSDLISSVTGAGEKSLDFATDRGGARGLVSVYFSAENVHSIPPETIEANTRIASDYLDAESAHRVAETAGQDLESHSSAADK